MLIVFTGNGKGKTTAALGQMMRATGRKGSALMIQFIKSASYPSGEDFFVRTCRGKLNIAKGGIGFVGILEDTHTFAEHKTAAQKTWRFAKEEIKKNRHALYVLDELNVAIHMKLISQKEVLSFLKKYSRTRNIVVTGRNAKKQLITLSDIATEMKELKFRFRRAAKNIEF